MKVQAIGIDVRKTDLHLVGVWTDRVTSPGRSDSRRPDQLVPMRRTCDLPGWHGSVLCPPITLLAQFVRPFVKSNRK